MTQLPQPLVVRRAVPFLFASDGDEPRRRRVADGALLGLSCVVLLLATLLVSAISNQDQRQIAAAVDDLLGWLDPLWRVVYAAATVACLVLVLLAVVVHRVALARDLSLAIVVTLLVGAALSCRIDDSCPAFGRAVWGIGEPTFPAIRLAMLTASLVVAAPDLTRPARDFLAAIVGLTTAASIVLGSAYPSHVLGGLALGLGIGALIRLGFGSAAGLPDRTRVDAALLELGVLADGLDGPSPASTAPPATAPGPRGSG